ncbi:hypothetical protein PHYBOEH_007739 [Phytophthora boehmeriae]|uniref:Arf-GAP domain-containing protein n=1 Tax=Phytophthora boehmeriae TaxID=109152 RepID=A0A8T1X696_9STRA|nr:hypothetical protein PHYBOEH_007739 [Phytophthora boehmeriae]
MTLLRRSSRSSSTSSVSSSASVKRCDSMAERLSPTQEVTIRLLPGNDRCVDCKAVCPQWAGVSFGVLLCLSCAGKHRSLGVQTSFVKSLAMDSWTATEIRALELGGNAKWVAVCAGAEATDLPLLEKYSSGVAKAYKGRVLLAAATDPSIDSSFTATSFLSMLAGIDSPTSSEGSGRPSVEENPAASSKTVMPQSPTDPTGETNVKCTTCNQMVQLEHLNAHSKTCSVTTAHAVEWRKYEREFGVAGEPLGFTLAKTNSGFAEVSRIIPGGPAENANVIVGSYLIGLGSVKNAKFDEIVDLLRTLPRPIMFHFVFRSQMAPIRPKAVISSVPEPRTVEINVTLQDKEELGCSLSTNEFNCVVRSVDKDCIASRHGVLVGSRVVAVNGRNYLKPKELIREICTAKRPIKLTLHRVEGLMRGWTSKT